MSRSDAASAHGGDTAILVIGAGIAGLAAARALVESGRQVTILEARDRPAGRIWTDRS